MGRLDSARLLETPVLKIMNNNQARATMYVWTEQITITACKKADRIPLEHLQHFIGVHRDIGQGIHGGDIHAGDM